MALVEDHNVIEAFAPLGAASGAQTSTLSFGFTYGANNGSVSTALKSKVK